MHRSAFAVRLCAMEQDVGISLPLKDEHNEGAVRRALLSALKRGGVDCAEADVSYALIKRSLDARHGRQKLFLRYHVVIGRKGTAAGTSGDAGGEGVPDPFEWAPVTADRQVVIVGAGPAGLFAALTLIEKGIRPVIVERGADVSQRKRDIARISCEHTLNPESNYCFGLGGAGTFSDGKLYTRSSKRGNIFRVLALLSRFGADMNILYDAHPHIGSDKLPHIVENITRFIERKGGKVLINNRCEDFIIDTKSGTRRVLGVRAREGAASREITGCAVMLCAGQNAPDIYAMVARAAPEALEAKGFAMGVRCEHPRAVIDAIQYHSAKPPAGAGAAEYRLTAQIASPDGGNLRGVYSFCMCPGGFVVPASSAPDETVVNGMSSSGRNSAWSNAAIVVETRPEDIPQTFIDEARDAGCAALAGLLYRRHLERKAFEHTTDGRAGAQRLTDFISRRTSSTLPASSYPPGVTESRLDEWLPREMAERLRAAFGMFNKKMRGFVRDDALLIAIESRTSSPVRILRDRNTFECTALKGLFPAGEGAGYAGGIVSSAMDGTASAERIAALLTSRA